MLAALLLSGGHRGGIRALNEEIKRRGFALNQQGSELKVSVRQIDSACLQKSISWAWSSSMLEWCPR